jgi:hypothetical protein
MAGANPVSTESMPNGSVASLWERNDKSVTLLIQDGNFSGNARGGLMQAVPNLVKVQGLTGR